MAKFYVGIYERPAQSRVTEIFDNCGTVYKYYCNYLNIFLSTKIFVMISSEISCWSKRRSRKQNKVFHVCVWALPVSQLIHMFILHHEQIYLHKLHLLHENMSNLVQ